ncbi:flagellar hook-associated protein 1 [mine drainage metagenome]|uniref:Flagellar hook-associated protein 1 n=1 Tax=mine drainage metagenome TaxID=410659 RepID=A0A1J5SJ47_9ZZZZ
MAIFGISVSALNAAQAGLATTSNNIANANTPGYSREQIVQTQMLPQNTGSGFMGQGVSVATVQRQYDQFLSAQVLAAQTQSSNLTTQLGLSQQVSNLLGDATGGLTPTLQDFFTAANGVANAPQSVPARQAMIGSAQTLVGRFQSLSQNLNQIRDGLNGQISNSVTQINSYASQIATLNAQIVQAQANNPNQPPNALLDQRDQLVNQLSQQIRVSTISQGDGSMNVYIGNGQGLVLGNKTMALQTVTSSTDPTALEVAYSNNGSVIPIQQNSLQGGNLGGYISFRQTVLDPAINALGRIAMGFADTFNQQQQKGTDLNGALGASMFTTAVPRVTPSSSNVGNGVLTATVSSTSALTGHDYSVQFDGTNYTVYDTTSNSAVQSFTPAQLAAGQTVTGTGITLQLTAGSVANVAGDAFLVRPTVDGASNIGLNITDPAKIAASSPVAANAPTTNLGTATIAPASVTGGLPLNANLQQLVTITFNNPPTTFNVTGTGTGNPTNVAYTAGATISYNGWSTQISGTPSAGDTFTVTQNTNATADGSNILQMAALQTANTLVNGTTSYQGAYAQLIAQVGTQTSQLTSTSQAQASLLTQVTNSQQAVSGVNLDEEAANLLRYQQAYQAAGKAMQIANTMFDTILNLK